MEQLTFLEPSNTDLDLKILKIEQSQEKLRRSIFAKFGALQQDYQFLYENLELIKDLVELIKLNHVRPPSGPAIPSHASPALLLRSEKAS